VTEPRKAVTASSSTLIPTAPMSAASAASRHGTVTRGSRAMIQSSTIQLATTPISRPAMVSSIRAPPPAIPVTRTAPSAIPIAMMLPDSEHTRAEAYQRHEVEQDPAGRGRPERRQAPLRRHGLPQVGHPPDARPHRAQQPDPRHRVALRHRRSNNRQHGVGRGRGHGLGDGLLQIDEPRRLQREYVASHPERDHQQGHGGHQTPTKLDPGVVEAADVVITMGCGETCPVFPGKRYEDWTVDDPAGQDIDTVRRIVDDVDGRVRKLLADLRVDVESMASTTGGRGH
jgi:hypothetical protein